jgi:ATP-dependent RNA helicase UAP56/SUB2
MPASPCFHSTEAYNKFKTNGVKILVTTDVYARGTDDVKVNVVINYDFPSWYEDKKPGATAATTPQDPVSIAADTYLHRVGRAGRFGNRGLAVSFLSSELDRKVLSHKHHVDPALSKVFFIRLCLGL